MRFTNGDLLGVRSVSDASPVAERFKNDADSVFRLGDQPEEVLFLSRTISPRRSPTVNIAYPFSRANCDGSVLAVTPRDVEVSVESRHTWRGDLRVTLTTPTGVEVVLTDGSGGSADDFVRTFRASDDPARFSDVLSGSAAGDWRLTVEDRLAEDVGTIAQWRLAITYSPAE